MYIPISRMVLVIVAVIVLVILGLIGWCIYRFFKKKRPKGAEKDKAEDDENALVDNEEANAEEVEKPMVSNHSFKGAEFFCCR